MKYIQASSLVNEIQDNLYSYYQSGIVDTSFLYPLIDRCLGLIGVKIYPKQSVTLDVKNYKAKLPTDYYSLILAVSCTTHLVKNTTPQSITTYEQRICDIPKCQSECDYCHDCNGRYQIVQRFEDTTYLHKNINILTIRHEDKSYCCNPISKNVYDIDIINNELHTNFKGGTVYMEYRGLMEKEGQLLVPDYPEITKWIIAECEKATFKRLFYNKDANVNNELQYSDKELNIALENARAFWKRNSLKDFYAIKKYLQLEFIKSSM